MSRSCSLCFMRNLHANDRRDSCVPKFARFVTRTEISLHRFNNNFAITVACSTVTVTKCQAALRTLQGFPFFKPTCLCREPHVDPDCNSFLNFVFDHPCSVVEWKGKDVQKIVYYTVYIVLSLRSDEKIKKGLISREKSDLLSDINTVLEIIFCI